ncbi:hypothetical protein SAMN05660742_11182 [Propionispira arboris]|uniref:SMODS and SLOG-associating 2TM effector domain-containing protein n=1 Tax=Propionispira arboris TaxID=84035 RepID=A0A1H7A4D2_9FIRM|nr:SLATT domain-containing protein [Propionispira arboris]SEJ59766.1 hypothetical protein SAMN05660742_11182 [Propionispira arboris]
MDKFDYKNSLENRIWITRKCRIHASERLDKWNCWTKLLQVYYSVILVGLSIYNLSLAKLGTQNTAISEQLLITSITVSFFSMYLLSQNYKERALRLKYNYHGFDELYRKITQMTIDDQYEVQQIIDIEKEYLFLLKSSENHRMEDFLSSQRDSEKKSWGIFTYAEDIFYRTRWVIICILFFVLPIFLFYRFFY